MPAVLKAGYDLETIPIEKKDEKSEEIEIIRTHHFIRRTAFIGLIPGCTDVLLKQRAALKKRMKTATGAEYGILDARQMATKVSLM